MKQLKLSLAAIALTLAFTIPAFAGDIQTGFTSPPPPPPAAMAAGDIETGTTASEATATYSLKEIALDLLQSVLSLF